MLEDEKKFHGFFRMNIEQFYCLSQLVVEELRKQNNYGRAISPEERLSVFFKLLAINICRRQDGESPRFFTDFFQGVQILFAYINNS